MGTTLFLHAVTGGPDEVRDALVAWNRAKGFELVERTLPAPDDEHERVGLVFSTQRWTGVRWSRFEEHDRLGFELRKLGRPALETWVYDSDAWGWKLWRDGRWTSAWASHPEYADVPQGAVHDRPALAAVCGADEDAIAAAERRRGVFAESAWTAFARAVGLFPPTGAFSPDVHDDAPPPPGVSVQRLRFRRAGWDPMQGFDVRALQFRPAPPLPAPSAEQVAARVQAESSARFHTGVIQLLFFPFRAFFWMLGLAFRGLAWLRGGRPFLQLSVPWRVDGDRVRSDAWGLSLPLGPGVEPGKVPFGLVLGVTLDGDPVGFMGASATQARARQVQGPAGTTHDVVDLEVDGLPARRVVATPPEGPATWTVFVQGPRFVVIGTAPARTPEVVARLDGLATTLRLEAPGAR